MQIAQQSYNYFSLISSTIFSLGNGFYGDAAYAQSGIIKSNGLFTVTLGGICVIIDVSLGAYINIKNGESMKKVANDMAADFIVSSTEVALPALASLGATVIASVVAGSVVPGVGTIAGVFVGIFAWVFLDAVKYNGQTGREHLKEYFNSKDIVQYLKPEILNP